MVQSFLEILKDFIHQEKREYCDSDWSEIKNLADHHQLSPVFYYQTRNPIFKQSFMSQICNAANRENALIKVETILSNVPYVIVKGREVAYLYPEPYLRTMGDIDILIHSEDREHVHELLIKEGFSFIKSWKGEWIYLFNGILFEIHDNLIHEAPGKEKLNEYFSHVWDYVSDRKLKWDFHFIYLIEHLMQHFIAAGVGFRQFMDIAIICKADILNWSWIEKELEKINLLEFTKKVLAFNEAAFAVESPIEVESLDYDFYEQSLQKILKDGLFGFQNEENNDSEISYMMTYEGIGYRRGVLRYFMRNLFPPYDVMKELYYCAYLKRHKLLLPFAWIHRWIFRFIDKEHRKEIFDRTFHNKKKTDRRNELLKKWGL